MHMKASFEPLEPSIVHEHVAEVVDDQSRS